MPVSLITLLTSPKGFKILAPDLSVHLQEIVYLCIKFKDLIYYLKTFTENNYSIANIKRQWVRLIVCTAARTCWITSRES